MSKATGLNRFIVALALTGLVAAALAVSCGSEESSAPGGQEGDACIDDMGCASPLVCHVGACAEDVGRDAARASECDPGESRACYEGPAETEDVGACTAGTETCGTDGEWSGICEDQVLPAEESCEGAADEDCGGEVDDCEPTADGGGGDAGVPDAGVPEVDAGRLAADAGALLKCGAPGKKCDDGNACTINDACDEQDKCVGMLEKGWKKVAEIDYRQADKELRWAKKQTTSFRIRKTKFDLVRVSGRVEGGGYCHAYWGTGAIGTTRYTGEYGYYNADGRYYAPGSGGAAGGAQPCPTYPPLFNSNGKARLCQSTHRKSGSMSAVAGRVLNLPAGSSLYLDGRHVIPNKGGNIRCSLEVKCTK